MPDNAPQFPFSDAQIEALLDGIYSGSITQYELPENLYFAIANYLKNGIYKGFGGNLKDFEGTPDFKLLTELRENIYMFSAAKTYQQVREISSLLTDGDRVRTESEFNKLGRATYDTWNNDWGKSEYRTAQASAELASKWADIEANKDILPILSYSTIGDACGICKPLDGLTLPVDDKRWNTITPPNHFNCFCLLTQHEEDEKDITPTKQAAEVFETADSNMSDVFKMNSGKDGYIFSPEHPYFDVEPKDKKYAANNFDLPIPEKD
jgi:hypothetical protein